MLFSGLGINSFLLILALPFNFFLYALALFSHTFLTYPESHVYVCCWVGALSPAPHPGTSHPLGLRGDAFLTITAGLQLWAVVGWG